MTVGKKKKQVIKHFTVCTKNDHPIGHVYIFEIKKHRPLPFFRRWGSDKKENQIKKRKLIPFISFQYNLLEIYGISS